MPALNGMELCRLARRNPGSRDTAILMISTNAHAYDVDAGLDAGADRYLPKPLSPRRLVDELEFLITNRFPAASLEVDR
jgi:two-component system response regulator MtrA